MKRKKDTYNCSLSKDKKRLYYRNGKRVAAADIPIEIKKNIPCLPNRNYIKPYLPFRCEDIKDILRTYHIPLDLYEPLSKYYRNNVNHLAILLDLFPNKPWDWTVLSHNPNITWEIVQNNPDKPWNWSGLSFNPNITWDII